MNPGPDLLIKYFNGQCTEEEIIRVKQWLDAEDSIEPDASAGSDSTLKDAIWNNIKPAAIPTKRRRLGSPFWYGVAASIVLAIGVHVVWHLYLKPTKNLPGSSSCYLKFVTPKGQKAKLTLSDGTIIQLNSDSKVQYPKKFTDSCRVVYLEGEAYFIVSEDQKKPFIVYTARTGTRVLGTEFNLRSRPTEKTTTMVVKKGKVKFGDKSGLDANCKIFIAGQKGTYSDNVVTDKVNPEQFIAWKDNNFIFKNTLFSQLVQDLERWYNIDITIKTMN